MIVRGALSRAAAMAAIKKSEAKSEEDVRVIYTLFHFLRKPTRICIKLFNALVKLSCAVRMRVVCICQLPNSWIRSKEKDMK